MSFFQPSLFDNLDAQHGYCALSKLNLVEAERCFKESLRNNRLFEKETEEALNAIEHWQRILSIENDIEVNSFLNAFDSFKFPTHLLPLKKAILTSCLTIINPLKLIEKWEPLFDLLLENKEYQTSIDLLHEINKVDTNNYSMYYHYGQAFHKLNNHASSHDNYGKALCLYPSDSYQSRIENEKILNLINDYGWYKAFLYGMLTHVFHPVKIPDSFHPINDLHGTAIKLYVLYQQAEREKALRETTDAKGTCTRAEINIRKEMKNADSVFFNHYLFQQ